MNVNIIGFDLQFDKIPRSTRIEATRENIVKIARESQLKICGTIVSKRYGVLPVSHYAKLKKVSAFDKFENDEDAFEFIKYESGKIKTDIPGQSIQFHVWITPVYAESYKNDVNVLHNPRYGLKIDVDVDIFTKGSVSYKHYSHLRADSFYKKLEKVERKAESGYIVEEFKWRNAIVCNDNDTDGYYDGNYTNITEQGDEVSDTRIVELNNCFRPSSLQLPYPRKARYPVVSSRDLGFDFDFKNFTGRELPDLKEMVRQAKSERKNKK